jgi:tetratricopeptide (TPR) repeat protein
MSITNSDKDFLKSIALFIFKIIALLVCAYFVVANENNDNKAIKFFFLFLAFYILKSFKQKEPSSNEIKATDYYNQGINKANLQDYDNAIKDYSNALLLNSNHAEAYYARGIAHYFTQNIEKSLADLKKSADLGNKNASSMIEKIQTENNV